MVFSAPGETAEVLDLVEKASDGTDQFAKAGQALIGCSGAVLEAPGVTADLNEQLQSA